MRRTRAGLVALNLAAALIALALAGLGTWQMQRLAWKRDLIARVEAHLKAPPAPPPGPADWSALTAETDAYRRLSLTGRFLRDRTVFVQAVTALGGGFWVMTPLRTPDGFAVLVNRGFVPSDARDPASWRRDEGEVALTGLLRMSEPGGAFLRANDPASGRWFSRDVAAIAQAEGLDRAAPYFVDADAAPGATGLPVAGLTVVAFPNNHLIYAITWYVLAAMTLAAIVFVDRDAWKRSRRA